MIINNIQFDVSLEEVFEELQRQLAINQIPLFQKGYKESGNSIQVQCPYHGDGQERRPSAGIRKSDGTFHCFACNEIHSLPEVISYCFGYTNDVFGKHGIKWLIKNFSTVQIEKRKELTLDFSRNKSHHTSIKTYVSEEELDKYRYYHPYWKKRGIVADDIIELFDLGFDKDTNCITFPVRDQEGNCLFVARRSVNIKWFNYPQGVDKPLYGLYELEKYFDQQHEGLSDYAYGAWNLYITESMIDCILLWQEGFFAVALNGTGDELQFKQLRELPCRKLILATDSDKAGQEARKKIRKNIRNKLITEVILPKGKKDIGECTSEEIRNLEEVFSV